MVRMFLGTVLIIAAVINEISLTVGAASAAHLSFFQYAMLNKFGIAVLLWGYNPALVALGGAAFIGGFLLVQAGHTAGSYRAREVTDWRSRV